MQTAYHENGPITSKQDQREVAWHLFSRAWRCLVTRIRLLKLLSTFPDLTDTTTC